MTTAIEKHTQDSPHLSVPAAGFVPSPRGFSTLSPADGDRYIELLRSGDIESLALAVAILPSARNDAKCVHELLLQIADLPNRNALV